MFYIINHIKTLQNEGKMNINTLIEKLKETTAYKERTAILTELIQPMQQPDRTYDIEASHIDEKLQIWGERYGGLEIYPDYQRGNDWEQADQIHYIENLLRGNVDRKGKTILVNIVGFGTNAVKTNIEHAVTILDGLQRYTAIEAFKKAEFTIFNGLSLQDLEHSKYHLQEIELHLAVYNFADKVQLLKFYKMINQTGKAHKQSEFDRIDGMITDLQTN